MFPFEIFHLALADAMLARAGASHGERPLDQALDESLDALHLLAVIEVEERRRVEIAVPDMADDRRQEAELGDVALRALDAFGKPRDRHAHIGREGGGARLQREAR